MKKLIITLLLCVGMILPLPASKNIKLKELPKAIVTSVSKLFGKEFEYDKIKVSDKRGRKFYNVRGEYNDRDYEILFDVTGKIVKLESEPVDDDDDKDED